MEEQRAVYSSNGSGDVFDSLHDIHLKDIVNILSARKNVILYTVLLLVMGAVAYVLIAKPMYTSNAKLLIEPSKVNLGEIQDVYDPTLNGMGGAIMIREYYDTQLKLILNRSSLEKTFNAFGYEKYDEFKNAKDQIKGFEKYFKVKGVRNTRLVDVSYGWYDPVVAKETLKYLLNEYIASNNSRVMGVTIEGLETLRLKAKDLAPRVDASGEAMQKFMVDNNMISLEETQNIVVEKLKQINTELVRAENEKIQYGSVLESLKSIRSGKVSLESIPEAAESQVVRDLKLQQSKVMQELSSLEGRYGASHPEVVSLRSQLSTVRSKLNSELHNILNSAEQKFKRASSQARDLMAALAEQEKRVHTLNQLSTEYKRLKEDNDTLKETYKVVDKRIKEIEISLTAGPKSSNIFVIEPLYRSP